MSEIAARESESCDPVFIHWVPKDVAIHPFTACGLNIDTPKALAWTRDTDLTSYQELSMQSWPPACPVCLMGCILAGIPGRITMTCTQCGGSGSLPTTEMIKMPGGGYKQVHGTIPCTACGGKGKQ